MVPGEWTCNSSGGTVKWFGVDEFFKYVTATKSYGPKATVTNNEGVWTSIEPEYIQPGDVLQFRPYDRAKGTDYAHSVIVCYVEDPANYNVIRICQYDRADASLMGLVYFYSEPQKTRTGPCFMRKLNFKSASFAK